MSHLKILPLAFGVLVLISMVISTGSAQDLRPPRVPGEYLVYVGTYTGPHSKGIYLYRLDPAAGTLSPLGLAAETVNPTFLAFDPKNRFLFAANEISDFENQRAGSVSAFAIDAATGKLTFLNRRSSRGEGPCHLLIDATGKNLLVANYSGGSMAVLPIQPDGQLKESSTFIAYEGKSIDPERQTKPYAHCVMLDAANRFAFVTDLGTDKIMSYKFDADHGTLTANVPPFVSEKPGSGPRHMTFGSDEKFAYVLNELSSSVDVFAYDSQRGNLRLLQTISTLPEDFKAFNTCAEVVVHPNGKFLYASNRGHNSIAVFAIDPDKGTLTLVERQSSQGKIPRNFSLDPAGKYLLVANQDSNNLVLFSIDPKSGKLTLGQIVSDVPSPVCVKFLKE